MTFDTKMEKGASVMCNFSEGIEERGRRAGRKEGLREGRQEGRNEVISLIANLAKNGRNDDIVRAVNDKQYMSRLLAEFQR